MNLKLILTGIVGVIIGLLIGYSFIQSVQSYSPTIIHDTINRRVDSIIIVEKRFAENIEKIKIIHVHKKDSIIHLPDSAQFDLFRSNCERYNYLLSHDSATAN